MLLTLMMTAISLLKLLYALRAMTLSVLKPIWPQKAAFLILNLSHRLPAKVVDSRNYAALVLQSQRGMWTGLIAAVATVQGNRL